MKVNKASKRVLSVVLCLVMLFTTFCIFDIGSMMSSAAAPTESEVYLYAPEVIYLAPQVTSWKGETSASFQYYVQNNVVNANNQIVAPGSVTTKSDKDTTGYLYFKGPAGATVSASKDSGITASAGAAEKLSDGNFKYKISGSASFAANVTGGYIEWIVTYTDPVDGTTKAVTARTYVYKPYTVPTGAITYIYNRNYTRVGTQRKNDLASTSWMSGFHNIAKVADKTSKLWPTPSNTTERTFAYGYYQNNTYNVAGFLTDTANGSYTSGYSFTNVANLSGSNFVNGNVEKLTDASLMYAAFAPNNFTVQTGTEFDPDKYVAKESEYANADKNNLYDTPTFGYVYQDSTGGAHHATLGNDLGAIGGIFIDTSRYTNLTQIPNLGVGLALTKFKQNKNESCDGAWIVADFSGIGTEKGALANGNLNTDVDPNNTTNGSMVRDNVNYAIAHCGDPVNNRRGDAIADTGTQQLKYAGSWVRSVMNAPSVSGTTEQTYTIKTYVEDHLKKHETVVSYLYLQATQTNKSALRTAVNNAMATLSNCAYWNGSALQCLYDVNAWSTFKTAYDNAQKGLTLLDGTVDAATLTSALTSATSALQTAVENAANTASESLKAQYDAATAKVEEHYTKDSWTSLATALASAKSLMEYNYGTGYSATKYYASASKFNTATSAIETALAGLKDRWNEENLTDDIKIPTGEGFKKESKTVDGAPYRIYTIEAPLTNAKGETFSWWQDASGKVVSTYRNYTFYGCTATNLTPVYGQSKDDIAKNYAIMRVTGFRKNSNTTQAATGTYSIMVERSINRQLTNGKSGLVAHGVIYADTQAKIEAVNGTTDPSTLGGNGVYVTSAKSTATIGNGLFEVRAAASTLPVGGTVYIRPYALINDTYYYCDIVSYAVDAITGASEDADTIDVCADTVEYAVVQNEDKADVPAEDPTVDVPVVDEPTVEEPTSETSWFDMIVAWFKDLINVLISTIIGLF